jgi:hypothetical protein
MSDAAPSSKEQVVVHHHALRAGVTDHGMAFRRGAGGRGVGRSEQSQATTILSHVKILGRNMIAIMIHVSYIGNKGTTPIN